MEGEKKLKKFMGKKIIAAFIIALVVLFVSAGISANAFIFWGAKETVEIYPLGVDGDWGNDFQAIMLPEVGEEEETGSFSGSNSAIYEGGSHSIFFSDFGATRDEIESVTEDDEIIMKELQQQKSWNDYEFHESILEQETGTPQPDLDLLGINGENEIVQEPEETPEEMKEETSTNAKQKKPGNWLEVASIETTYLNVRGEASVEGEIIGKVKPGETYQYEEEKDGWYKIKINEKKSGWVFGEYVIVKTAPGSGTDAIEGNENMQEILEENGNPADLSEDITKRDEKSPSFLEKLTRFFKGNKAEAKNKVNFGDLVGKEFTGAKIKMSFAVVEIQKQTLPEEGATDETLIEDNSGESDVISPDETESGESEPVPIIPEEPENITSFLMKKIGNLLGASKASAEEEVIGEENKDENNDASFNTDIDAKIIIWYSLDGENWEKLDTITQSSTSNRQNGGYFSFDAPFLKNWQDLKNLRVKLEGAVGGETNFTAYLDSVWAEVEYQDAEGKNPEMRLPKKDWQKSEQPRIEITDLVEDKSILEKTWEGATSVFQDDAGAPEIKVKLTSPDGKEIELEKDKNFTVVEDKNPVEIKILPDENIPPGKYAVEVSVNDGGEEYSFNEEFTWGVLAINANKSIYAPNEKGNLAMAVLDERGNMVCDAKLRLEIRNPKSEILNLTTEDGTIKVNEEICSLHNFTLEPDYEAEYQFGDEGTYELTLTAETRNGTHTISDKIEVRKDVPFDVERVTATRIYPPSDYPVTLNITANEDFEGEIVETVPESFEILPPAEEEKNPKFSAQGGSASGGEIQNSNDQNGTAIKYLIWKVDIRKGEKISLGYKFNAPDVSPEFYLLGPLKFIDETLGISFLEQTVFQEARQWQIAADAPIAQYTGGLLVYADTVTAGTPRYKTFDNTTGFGSEQDATSVGAAAIEWIRVAASPTNDEWIIATRDADDDIDVQVCTGVDGGVSCGSVTSISTDAGAHGFRNFDVAYEMSSGDALLVYGTATTDELRKREWTGGSWQNDAAITTTNTAGLVEWVELTSRPGSDQIGIAYSSDTADDVSAYRWSGSAVGDEATADISTGIADNVRKFDVSFEGTSGDMLVCSPSTNGSSVNCGSLSAAGTWTIANETPPDVLTAFMDLMEPGSSNYISISAHGVAATTLSEGFAWDGAVDIVDNVQGDDNLLTWGANYQETATSYFSSGTYYALGVISSSAATDDIDWWTVSSAGAVTDRTVNTRSRAAGRFRDIFDYPNADKVLLLTADASSDLWADAWTGAAVDATAWVALNGGATLEDSLASATTDVVDFAFRLAPMAITVSGGCYTDAGEGTPCSDGGAGDQIKVAVNGVPASGSDGTVDGGWEFTIPQPASGAILTFYRDGAPTAAEKATTVVKYDGDGGNVTNVRMYQSMLVIGADSGSANDNQTIANSDLDTAGNGFEYSDDNDSIYGVDTGTLTVDQGTGLTETLYIINGDTYQPDLAGGDTVNTHHLYFEGILTLDSNAINVTGNWTDAGTLTAHTSTATFNGSAAQTITSNGHSLYAVVFNNSLAAPTTNISCADALTISNNVTLSNNTRIASTNTAITISGTINGANVLSINSGSGTVTFGNIIGGSTPIASLTSSGSGTVTTGVSATAITVADVASNNVSFTGPVTLGAGLTITTDKTTNDGTIIFSSTIDSADTTDRALTLTAGGADVSVSGAIGATNDLASITMNGNDITLANIGAGSAGVTGATSITSADNGGDYGVLTLSGTVYRTNAATYTGGSSGGTSITGASAAFYTTGDNVIFTATRTVTLGDISAVSVTISGNGAGITFGTIRGTSDEDITLNAGPIVGTVTVGLIGDETANEINTVNLSGLSVTLNGNIYTSDAAGNTVTLSGPNTYLGTDVTIDTDEAANDGDVSIGIINSVDANDRSLTINSGSVDISISGPVGATNDLSSLTLTGNDISLANIGGGSAGVIGATSVTGTDPGADPATLTFTGTTYNANQQTYAATAGNNFAVNGGATTTFTSTNDAIAFNTANILLANGSNLAVNSGGGAITALAINGNSSETLSLTSTGGGTNTVSVGAIGTSVANGILSVALSGSTSVTLNGSITTANDTSNNVTVTGPALLGTNIIVTTDTAGTDGAVNFTSTINGGYTLTLANGGGAVSLGGIIGGSAPINALSVTGSGTVTAGASATAITVADVASNNVSFAGPIALGVTSLTITTNKTTNDGSITFSSTIDGPGALITNNGNGSVTFDGNIGASTPITALNVQGLDGTAIINAASITTRDVISNVVYFWGPVILGNNLIITTDNATNDGSISFFGSSINSADATDQALSLVADSADILVSSIGATNDLASLIITGNDITLANIGSVGGAVGVTGTTSVTSTDAGDTGVLTLGGTVYRTNAATYAGGSSGGVSITGASADFYTSADNITFTNTVTLGNIGDASVTTSGSAPDSGNITFGTIRGTSDEDVTLNASSANVNVGLIGDETANEIRAVALTGATITLNGNIFTSDLSGNNATLTGAVALGAGVIIDTDETTNDGTITFSSTVNGNQTLTINAGSAQASFNGNVGASTALGVLTKQGAGDMKFGSNTLACGGLTLSAGTINTLGTDSEIWTVNGNVTISAGTLRATTNTLSVAGDWANSGTFTAGSGTVDFTKGAGTQTLNSGGTGAGYLFNTFTHSGAGTLQIITNDLDIDGNFDNSNASGTFDANGKNMSIKGTYNNSGTFTAGAGTVTFDATTGTKTLSGTMTGSSAFNSIVFNDAAGDATFRPTANITVNADLTLTDGILDLDTSDPTVQLGNDSGTGNVNINGGSITASNSANFILNDDSTEYYNVGGVVLGNVVIGASPATTNLKSDMTAASLTVSAGDRMNTKGYDLDITTFITVNGILDCTDTGGGGYAGNGTNANLGTTWTVDPAGTFTADEGTYPTTVIFDHTSSGNLSPGGTTENYDFYNLQFSKSSAATITLQAAIHVENNLSITTANSTLDTGTNYAINVGGDWSNSGTFTPNSGTVTFDSGDTGETINSGGTGAGKTFNDVAFNNSAGGWIIQTSDMKITDDLDITNIADSADSWTLDTGRVLEVNGTYTVTGTETAYTKWTGSTFYINGTSQEIGSKTQAEETYDTLHVGTDDDIRMWQSSAATYTVDSGASLYSMDHDANDGDLYVWGDYNVPSGTTDYWNYAEDFDGVAGANRQVDVKIDPSGIVHENFEGTGYEKPWTEAVTAGCTVDEDSTDISPPSGGGSQILEFGGTALGDNAYTVWDNVSGINILYWRAYVYISALPSSASYEAILLNTTTSLGNVVSGLQARNSSGQYQLRHNYYSGGAAAATDPVNINANQWYRAEGKYDVTNLAWEWKIDGVTQHSGALTATTRQPVKMRAGIYNQNLNGTETFYLDQVAWDGTGWVETKGETKVTVGAGETLEAVGTSGNRTTVSRQGSSGGYPIDVATGSPGGTIDFQYTDFDYLEGTTGLNIASGAVVTSLNNTAFDNMVNSGTDAFITVDSAVISTGNKTITGADFSNTGAAADCNVNRTGADDTEYWDFDSTTGDGFASEAYDCKNSVLPPDEADPGMLRWDDSTGSGITVSGTVWTNEGKTIPIADGRTVHLYVNTTNYSTTTTLSGAYSFNPVTVAAGDSVLVYLDEVAEDGSTVTLALDAATAIDNLDIITAHITLEHRAAGPINNTDLDDIDGLDAEAGITISGGNAVFSDNFELSIVSGENYTPGGTVTCDDFEAEGTGTFAPEANAVTVSGDWEFSATGTFTTSGTVTFDGALAQAIITGGKTFSGLTLNNTGSTGANDNITISGALDVDGTFDINNGDLILTSGNPNVNTAGDVTIGSSAFVTKGTGTWTFDGTTAFQDTSSGGPQNIGLTAVNGTSLTMGSSMKVDKVTVTAGSLNLGSSGYILILAGSGAGTSRPLYMNGGTLNEGTNSTVRFYGISNSEIQAETYYNLELYAPGAAEPVYTLGTAGSQTITVSNNLTTDSAAEVNAATYDTALDVGGNVSIGANGTLIAPGSASFNVEGSWTITGEFTHSSGTVTFDSTDGGETIVDGSWPFYDVEFSGSGGEWLYADGADGINQTSVSNGTATYLNTKRGTTVSVTGGTLNIDWYLGVKVVDAITPATPVDTGATDITISENNSPALQTVWKWSSGAWGSPLAAQTTGTDGTGIIPQPGADGAIRIREYSKTLATTTYYKYNLYITWQANYGEYDYFQGYGDSYITSTASDAGGGVDKVIDDDWQRTTPSTQNDPEQALDAPPTNGTWYNGMLEAINFDIDSFSKDFGTITPGGDPTNIPVPNTLTVTTSASHGYVIYAREEQPMTCSAPAVCGAGEDIDDWGAPNSLPTDWDSGPGFGYSTNDYDLQSGGGAAGRFWDGDEKLFAGFIDTGFGDPVADRTGPGSAQENEITYRIAAEGIQNAGPYQTSIYYVAVPVY